MDNENMQRMRDLIELVNHYRHAYYILKSPLVSDEEYDKRFKELTELQLKLSVYMANSPVMYPGYPPVDKLEMVQCTDYPINMNKTSDVGKLLEFQRQYQLLLLPNLKGVSVRITYEDHQLQEIATVSENGAGYVVTHNACSISDVPIAFDRKDRLVVAGKLFMNMDTFESLRKSLVNKQGTPYTEIDRMIYDAAHLLAPKLCARCKLRLLVTEVLEGMENIPSKSQRLAMLSQYGFVTCKYLVSNRPLNIRQMEQGLRILHSDCQEAGIPESGAMLMFNDAKVAALCGKVGLLNSDRIIWLDPSVQPVSTFVA